MTWVQDGIFAGGGEALPGGWADFAAQTGITAILHLRPDAPAVVPAITMPLTYSIATGIGLGFITYALAKLISGKYAEASPAVLVLAVLFAVKFAVAG